MLYELRILSVFAGLPDPKRKRFFSSFLDRANRQILSAQFVSTYIMLMQLGRRVGSILNFKKKIEPQQGNGQYFKQPSEAVADGLGVQSSTVYYLTNTSKI